MDEWQARREALARAGLNLTGVAPGVSYGDLLSGCHAVVVFASGGGALWQALLDDLRRHPEHLHDEDHPLDAFVARAVRRVDPEPGPERRWVFCSATESTLVDFRTLALRAGLGWTSRLGLLLSPQAGPWLGLRAACFTTEPLPPSPPLPGEGPCAACPAPCVGACPGAAVHPEQGWQVEACARFHRESSLCASTCHARVACPEGAAWRYSTEELAYHSNRAEGRRALARALGIADQRVGVGPHWEAW